MRRLLVLAALLAVMLGIRLLQPEDQASQDTSMVLAAIGFVLLASFTVAELGSALTLPRVTGYILTGAVLAFFGILSPPVVLEMKMFNTLALGLIAISAGLELSVEQLKSSIKTLGATILGKLLLAVPLVGLTFYLYETRIGALGLATDGQAKAVGLVLGALALGTSPAIALAIISESKSRGRLTELVLGAAIVKDLVVVICLAVAVALARGFLAPIDGSSGGLSHVFLEIGYSLGSGGVLGLLLILYIRYVRAEMLLFVAAMILVVAEVSTLLHLELLLVFIAGGFVVRNFSPYEHELLDPVQLVSLPVFVVFFTIAGASIDLGATLQVLPLALALCAARAVAYYGAARFGNAFGGEAASVRENAWFGYLPQAGVTLGLVGLASAQLGEVSRALVSTGMAVVAINLLLGPIALRIALKRAGEVPGGTDETDGNVDTTNDDGDAIVRFPEPLQPPLRRLEAQLNSLLNDEELDDGGWLRAASRTYRDLGEALDDHSFPDASPDLWSNEALTALSDGCRGLFLSARRHVRNLPELVDVPLEPENRKVAPGDPWGIRFRKRSRTIVRLLTLTRKPVRRVPVRELARVHFEPRLAELASFIFTSNMRLLASIHEELTLTAQGKLQNSEFEHRVAERFSEHERVIRSELRHVVERGFRSLNHPAQIADTPYLPRTEIRASAVERSVTTTLLALEQTADWAKVFDAGWRGARTAHVSREHAKALQASFRTLIASPARNSLTETITVFESWLEAWPEVESEGEIDSAESPGETCDRLLHAFDAFDGRIHGEGAAQFGRSIAKFRSNLDLRALGQEARRQLANLSDGLVLISGEQLASQCSDPSTVGFREVDQRRLAERMLTRDALHEMENLLTRAADAPREASSLLFAEVEATRLALRAAIEHASPEEAATEARRLLIEARAKASSLIGELHPRASGYLKDAERLFGQKLEKWEEQIRTSGPSLAHLVRTRDIGRYIATLRERLSRSVDRFEARITKAVRAVSVAWQSELARKMQAMLKSGTLDTGTVREFLDWHCPPIEQGSYAALFGGASVREPSQFIAHRELLSEALTTERHWAKGGPSSFLFVGEPGSGRTSMLNMIHHGTSTERVFRPNPVEWRRKVGLLRALAYEIGCRPKSLSIKNSLEGARTLIVVDDLEEWFKPGLEGLGQLETFLDLVARTGTSAFWAISVSRSWFELMSSVTDVAASFAKVASLDEVSPTGLREVIEKRHAQSDRKLYFPQPKLTRGLAPGQVERARTVFFALLARATGGNLARAFAVWTRLVDLDEPGVARVRLTKAVVVGLPFLRLLSSEQTALLATLCRFGPLSEKEIAQELQLEAPLLRRQLNFLHSSGLVTRSDARSQLVELSSTWEPFVQQALTEVRAL